MINFVEVERINLNFSQRWSSYLTIIVAAATILGGYFLRTRSLNAVQGYENKSAGILARYPVNWLIDENGRDYVFRAQDPAALPFKTTLQISIIQVGPDAQTSDLPDMLNITRANSLSAYRTLTITPLIMPNRQQTPGLRMEYAYVASETNPFLQTVPIVVHAIDVIILRRNQALIITYRANTDSFDKYRYIFDAFLRSLEY